MAPNSRVDSQDELLTLAEAAAMADVHRDTLRAWCARGRLSTVPGSRSGERRVRRSDVERFLRAPAKGHTERATGEDTTERPVPAPNQEGTAAGLAGAITRPPRRRKSDRKGVSLAPRPAAVDASMPMSLAPLTRSATAQDTLRRLASDVSDRHHLDALYQKVLAEAARLFAADRTGIGLWISGTNQPIEIVASENLPDAALAVFRAMSPTTASAGFEALRTGRLRVIAASHPDIDPRIRSLYEELGIATACFVPIVFQGDPLGLIAIYHDQPHEWTPEAQGVAQGLGETVATAVGSARLVESVQSLAARLQSVQDLAARLNGLTDVGMIGEAIVAEAGSLIAFDTIRVYRVDPVSRYCEPIAFEGTFMGTGSPAPEALRVPIGTGLTGWVAEHNLPLMVGDAQADGRSVIVGRTDGPESMLVVPMSFESSVRGVIVLSRLGIDQFTADDQTTLTIFAGYAAQAIVNAERLEQLHLQQAELEHQLTGQRRLMAVNERLLSTLDASSVLELVADSLKAVVTYDALTIYRVDVARQVRFPVIARDRFAEIILGYEAPLRQGITGWAVEHQEAVLANDAIADPRSVQIPGTPVEPESLIVVPLIVQGDVLGTLNVARIGEAEAHFSENEFELVKLFAAQAAIALRNAETHGVVKVQAERDALTGLRNHGAFQRELSLSIATIETHPLAVLMMDLDRFKAYNDRQGHPAGDELLAAVARTIESAVREGDSCYRYGGDEFTVILPGTDRVGASEVAQRIRTMIDALGEARTGPSVSISIGIACLPEDGTDKDTLMETADAALYVSKGSRLRSSMRDPLVVALDETAGVLLQGGTTDALLNSVLGRAARLLGTPHGYLSMVESTGLHLRMRAGHGLYASYVGHVISVSVGVAGTVCRTGKPFNVDDYSRFDDRAADVADMPLGAVLGVPLMSHGRVMGMIGVASGTPERTWGEADVDALTRFAKLASIALENARLQEAALRGPTDPVTGLPTRERLVEAIEAALKGPTDSTIAPTPTSVLLLDIDRFKVLNESLGHQAGDQVLAEVGRRIATVLRDGDLVARFGGDEFGILLSPADDARATAVADQILAALKAPVDLDSRLWFISASVGYVTGMPGHSSAGGLLREAEVALVQAQGEPTTRVARFDAVRSHAALQRLDLEADLQAAIEMDELLVHYQPIVDLRTERIVGFEALVRWQHPERGIISPLDFIPLAEETDLIIPLGAVVLAKACRQARELRDRWPGERLMMSVNLSPRQFADSELVASIAATLAETGLEASALELEITETAVMDRSEAGIAALAALRGLGVHLVLDDFGTGYSSLAHLRHLPLDTIKIDRSFVTELDEGDPNVAIVQAVLSLAHGLGITVVAEGIEQVPQADRLRELGCDLGQGYLWSRPIPAEQLDQLMSVAVTQRRLPKSRSRNKNKLMKSR